MRDDEKYKKDVEYIIRRLAPNIEQKEELIEEAKRAYGMYHDNTSFRSVAQYPKEGLAAGAIVVASRSKGLPVMLKDLHPDTGDHHIGKFPKLIQKETDIKAIQVPVETFVDHFADLLDVSDDVRERAKQLADDYPGYRKSQTVAAGAIYAASLLEGEEILQKRVASATGIAEISIRDCYKEMM